jgi:serine/threonine protein kinase
MSVVFRARRLADGADVAIKFLRRKHFSSPAVTARFRRECRVSMELCDHSIVRVFEAGEYEGGGFLVMEYLPLGGVDGLLQATELNPAVSFSIAIQTAEALAVIHKKKIVHRDVKFSNLLIESWNQETGEIKLKLSDFGICKELATEGLTRTGNTLGTDFYISPEQLAAPAEVDARADIYSLGVLIYRIFSKKFPTGEYRALSQLNPALPEELDKLVKKCLQQEPECRPESAQVVAEELWKCEKMNVQP